MDEPKVPDSARMRFRARARTRWSDEDNHGVLNNAVYLTLLEEARHAYFTSLGLMDGARFPFLVAQTHLRFLAPGRGGAEVEIELATTRLGASSFEQAYRVLDFERRAVWCEAEALLVCCDAASGKSQAMSTAFRRAIAEREGLSPAPGG